jgi:hypothetical protein
MFGWFVDIYVEYLFRVVVRAVRLVGSRDWAVVRGTVLSAECPHAGYGCTVATVYYEYIVGGQKYGAAFEKAFVVYDSGARFAGGFVKGAEFAVRVDPGDSAVTVPC